MPKTTDEILKEKLDEYIESKTFKEELDVMLSKVKTQLIKNSEAKARKWTSIAAATVIGIFVILVGLQYVALKEKYAEIKNTHADIKKEFIEINQTQKSIKDKYKVAEVLVHDIENKLSVLDPKVKKAIDTSERVIDKYNILDKNVISATERIKLINDKVANIERKLK